VTRVSHQIVYPEGDVQEVSRRLRINELVDLNGGPLALPLATPRMIVYRVWRISTDVERGSQTVSYFLELVRRDELEELIGP
jgi:hypothetical protein